MDIFELIGNGVKLLITDANNEIPDGVLTERVVGANGHVYKSGTFESMQTDIGTQWVYIIKAEPWPAKTH